MTDARDYLSASSLSHAEMPFGLALRRYPAFSCGVQRKPTRAVAGFLRGGLPRGRLGLSMADILPVQIILDKPSERVFNVRTLNQEAKMKKREWLTIKVSEPFPVLFGHVSRKTERCGEAEGPFYAAGATWYYAPEHMAWVERSAAMMRGLGYTVTVSAEWR